MERSTESEGWRIEKKEKGATEKRDVSEGKKLGKENKMEVTAMERKRERTRKKAKGKQVKRERRELFIKQFKMKVNELATNFFFLGNCKLASKYKHLMQTENVKAKKFFGFDTFSLSFSCSLTPLPCSASSTKSLKPCYLSYFVRHL